MANGCLPRGGDVNIHLVKIPEGTGIAVEARGLNVRLTDDIKEALLENVKVEHLNAHNVHACYAQCLARDAGGVIETQDEEGGATVQFAILLPKL